MDYLADDYELGKRIADLGLTVKLSDVVVETYLPSYRLREFFAHQLRWARGVRDARTGGYLGLVFTFGFLWALLALMASRGALWAWGALAVTLLLRLAVAASCGPGRSAGSPNGERFLADSAPGFACGRRLDC